MTESDSWKKEFMVAYYESIMGEAWQQVSGAGS